MIHPLQVLLLVGAAASVVLMPLGQALSWTAAPASPRAATTTTTTTPTPVAVDLTSIQEPACLDAARRIVRVPVPVGTNVHPDGQVDVSYAHWPASGQRGGRRTPSARRPPLVLVHGFDSSCLEYRRLGPQLADRGFDVYAVDLLGWGFTQLEGVTTFSASAKVEALRSFLDTIVVPPSASSSSRRGNVDLTYWIAGASLGGAAAIEVASSDDPRCGGLILLDAQGFVDGIGPMASLPVPLAKVGVEVLRSVPLRSAANQMSYCDKAKFATDEAVIVGRLHCMREGWSDALVSFMRSGGFAPSSKVPQVQVPTLVVWGRQDGILEGTEFAPKFLDALPDAELVWIEECGHVPHLEQPEITAQAIAAFVVERSSRTGSAASTGGAFAINNAAIPSSLPGKIGAFGIAAGAAAFLASFGADFLPVH